MQLYANNSGRSNIIAYKIGADFIIIRFSSAGVSFYKYTHGSAGRSAIDTMKQLAQNGSGLNAYISSKSTQPAFESKGSTLESVI